MKISVAMATYNGEKYIEDQIMSILKQSVNVDEIVIVDDGSTDNTVTIINNLQKQYDIIKLHINEENLGYSKNFRKALSLTTGECIFLCDQDDEWKENKVEILQRFMFDTKCDVVTSQFEMMKHDGSLINNSQEMRLNGEKCRGKGQYQFISPTNIFFENKFPGCTCCLTKRIKDIFLRIECDEMIHDYAILLLASMQNGVCYVNQVTMKYRIHFENNIGIKKKKREFLLDIHIPKKPLMVKFLEASKKVIKIPCYYIYIMLAYLRIPYVVSIIKRIIQG